MSIPPLEAGESYILLEGRIFLWGCGNLRRSDFESFSKLKTTSFKIKISMTCVYKEHEIKRKNVQEQLLQLKIKFSLGYNMKLLFSGEDGGINLWWEDKNLVGGGSTAGDFPRWGE